MFDTSLFLKVNCVILACYYNIYFRMYILVYDLTDLMERIIPLYSTINQHNHTNTHTYKEYKLFEDYNSL